MIIKHQTTGQKIDCKQYGWWLVYLGWVKRCWLSYDDAWQMMLKDNEKIDS